MVKGDLVHIPQGALLLGSKDPSTLCEDSSYLKIEKPSRAIFWCLDTRNPSWASVYYKEKIWDVRSRDIYPITQELENVS
ncbi:MAG: hypothetical protein CMI27_05740 [Opitutae bacterium]|nr:hypothetical protein [Opitutae bacterium]|tara:strand:+ start:11176 stop:11415 length:240 start_codon:yes stop_codon:yes gene_type:complete